MFKRQGWIARDGPEAPNLLTGVGVVRGGIAAGTPLGAAVADEDLAASNSGRAGNKVGNTAIRNGIHFPDFPTGGSIERDQVSVERGDNHLTKVHGNPSTKGCPNRSNAAPINFGVEDPLRLARDGIDRVDDVPCRRINDQAVDNQRRGFLGMKCTQIFMPCEPEVLNVVAIDLC